MNLSRTFTISLCLVFCLASFSVSRSADSVPADGDAIAAKVNGKPILMDDLNKNLKLAIERNRSIDQEVLPEEQETLKKKILDTMIDELLLEEIADADGITVSDKEVEETIKQFKQRYGGDAKFIQALQTSGRTLEELKDIIRRGKRIQKLLDRKLVVDEAKAEQEAQAYYNEHPQEFVQQEAVRVSHILIRVKADADEAQRKEAHDKAAEILKKLRSGEDFAKLADEYSEGPGAKRGGDLGWILPGSMDPAFDKVAFSLAEGEVSGIVETPFGYHLIKVTEKRDPRKLDFEWVKKSILRKIEQEMRSEKKKEFFSKLRQQADIEVLI